jgi:alcohol dehydrogenase
MDSQRLSENLQSIPSGEYAFLPVDKILFGPGSVRQLPEEVKRLDAHRVLLVTTGSVARSSLLEQVQNLLGNTLAGTFSGVHQHAPSETVVALVNEAERLRADLLVSLGGGSTIDTTKAAILALARDIGTFLPHIALPTTLSASEFSPLFGVTDEQTRVKAGASNPFVTPRVAILDVNLTDYTPDWLWLGTGVRALDHAVETVYAPDHQPATDAPALEAIRLLFTYLPASRGDASKNARQHCQIAAWLSFFGVANITLGLSHALGRQIGPRYDVPHGYTSAVLLPKVMEYLLPATGARQALVAEAAGVEVHGLAESEAARQAPEAVFELVRRLGLPQRLHDLGVPEEDLPSLAGGRDDVLQVLRAAW